MHLASVVKFMVETSGSEEPLIPYADELLFVVPSGDENPDTSKQEPGIHHVELMQAMNMHVRMRQINCMQQCSQ